MKEHFSAVCPKCGEVLDLDYYMMDYIRREDVLNLIDKLDEEPCCHGINKEDLKQKIKGEK